MVMILTSVAIVMFVFGFAMVPLYSLFCQVAGIQTIGSNTPASQTSLQYATKTTEASSRWITIKFDATVGGDLPWEVRPAIRKLRVRTGELQDISYIAHNLADEITIGQAIPSVVPWQATGYFNKTECFCFQQQKLAPRETREMKLRFIVSQDLPDDIDSLTLSYSFMNSDKGSKRKLGPQAKPEARSAEKDVTAVPASLSKPLVNLDKQSSQHRGS